MYFSCLCVHFLVIWLVKSNSGELIGGLDIIKEMVESGELQTMLPKKVPSMYYLPPYEAALMTNVMCSLHSLRFPLTRVLKASLTKLLSWFS